MTEKVTPKKRRAVEALLTSPDIKTQDGDGKELLTDDLEDVSLVDEPGAGHWPVFRDGALRGRKIA